MKSRRTFFSSIIGVSAVSLLPFSIFANVKQNEKTTETIKPKRLKKGDTIGLIAPGYAIKPDVLEKAKETLVAMGFVPYHTERLLWNHGYFSNTDTERATDINEMFANPNIDGILCARGGYGCTRIMHLLNYELIKNNPKVLVGFSDITALANGIYSETGLVTFHGPVGSTLDDKYSIQQLENVIIHPEHQLLIKNAILEDETLLNNPEFDRYTITTGKATGTLVGGSLTLINALIGTPHEIDFTDAIVFIEDVEEAPYRIDRMLTQLIQSATFKHAAGIMVGVCNGCDKPAASGSFTLREVILDRLKPLNIPAAYGMSFGHVKNNMTLPIGIKATFDADKMTLKLQEKAVL
ncbi:S66 peptidase family protein [Cellulophaga baltica]|uniref:S66 peptidase family protein n=1 Tax=Cellulophaga baltica TaxID=76594 RepID=UPI0003FF9743|nr:LD-carboxypeptidase [Cellulophaga baltica]AIY13626.1 peptidase U61 [Cellulophaga baltica NN016038]